VCTPLVTLCAHHSLLSISTLPLLQVSSIHSIAQFVSISTSLASCLPIHSIACCVLNLLYLTQSCIVCN
jgi:hypothetical protein